MAPSDGRTSKGNPMTLTKYQKVQAIAAAILALFVLGHLTELPTLLGACAVGCLGYAALQTLHDRGWFQDAPPPSPRPPEARLAFGQRPAAYEPPATYEPPPPTPAAPMPAWQGVKQWVRPAKAFLERMAGVITGTLHDLSSKQFGEPDPILTPEQSHAVSLAHSAIIRHGHVIETALRESLKDCDRFDVWDDPAFEISHQADGAFKTLNEAQCRQTELAYRDGVPIRKVQVDLIAFDRRDNVIRAYEIKRGYGGLSAGSQAEVSRDVHTLCMLLKSYAATHGYNPVRGEAHLVAYYGEGWSKKIGDFLDREDLDKHFGWPVVAAIESATAQFRAGLQAILAPQYRGNDRRAA
jgi:hypothetical protein